MQTTPAVVATFGHQSRSTVFPCNPLHMTEPHGPMPSLTGLGAALQDWIFNTARTVFPTKGSATIARATLTTGPVSMASDEG